MEIDGINSANSAINTSLASNSTQGLDHQSLGLNKKPSRAIDITQEHTNGRMFEQAVQNANKAGATPGSSVDNVKLSNAKVDRAANARNENPLTLSQKDARLIKRLMDNDDPIDENSAETIIKQILKSLGINTTFLSQMSKDTIALKGQAIDTLTVLSDEKAENDLQESEPIVIGASANIREQKELRKAVEQIATETYGEISHIEMIEEQGLFIAILQSNDATDFAKQVCLRVLDRPAILVSD